VAIGQILHRTQNGDYIVLSEGVTGLFMRPLHITNKKFTSAFLPLALLLRALRCARKHSMTSKLTGSVEPSVSWNWAIRENGSSFHGQPQQSPDSLHALAVYPTDR